MCNLQIVSCVNHYQTRKIMTGIEIHERDKFWIKQKNALEYALAKNESEKQIQVSVIKTQKVRNFIALIFKVVSDEKVIFVEKSETILV